MMFLYDEKRLSLLEQKLRLPVLVGMLALSYQVFPFLFCFLGGSSHSRPGFLLWLLSSASVLGLTHSFADTCCPHIIHALPRIAVRFLILLLAIPLGALLSFLWPLVLLMAGILFVVFIVMNILK